MDNSQSYTHSMDYLFIGPLKPTKEYSVPPDIYGKSMDVWKERVKSFPGIECTPSHPRQSEDGWKGRVKKLSENTKYPQPSMDSPRMAGRGG